MNPDSVLSLFRSGEAMVRLSLLRSLTGTEGEWINELIKLALLDGDGWVKVEAIRLLTETQNATIAPLCKAWVDSLQSCFRWEATKSAHQWANANDMSVVVDVLLSVDWWDRLRMPWVLSRSGDSRGTEMLVQAQNAEAEHTRLAATWLLANLKDTKTAE